MGVEVIMIDFLVIFPGAELDRSLFWKAENESFTFKNPRALFREAVSRSFSPPLSAIAVATTLQSLGYVVKVLDVALEFGIPFNREGIESRYDLIQRFIESNFPRYGVFLSSLTAREHIAISRIAEIIKSIDSLTPVILGGYHANSCTQEILNNINIDMIFLGDFEPYAQSFAEVLTKPNWPVKVREVAPVVTRNHRLRPPLNDQLPIPTSKILSDFDFSIVSHYLQKYDMLGMVASKGCPFPCKFCQEHAMRTNYAILSPNDAVDVAIRIFQEYRRYTGIDDIGFYFMDALFGNRHGWLTEFTNELIKRGSPLRWTFQTRVDVLRNCDFFALKEAGCYVIHVGLESFSPTTLLRMAKTRTPEKYLSDFKNLMQSANAAGIDIEFNILFGIPGETRATLEETEKGIQSALDQYPNSTVNLNLYRLFPETASYIEATMTKYGSKVLIPDWWEKGIVPEITATVQPSEDLNASQLIKFFERMYSSDAAYRRRGSFEKAQEILDSGWLTHKQLPEIAAEKRLAFTNNRGRIQSNR
jgi:radical SAM superfamily enzyme YgiQ (UPF0313 family)